MTDSIYEKHIKLSPEVEKQFGMTSHEIMSAIFHRLARRSFEEEGNTEFTDLDLTLRAQKIAENYSHVLETSSEQKPADKAALPYPQISFPKIVERRPSETRTTRYRFIDASFSKPK